MILDADPMPLYFQIKSIFKSRILSNELRGKERLPSEDALCKQYNVSRGTLRQALSELLREGLIYRVHGKGTFVSEGAGLRELKFNGTIENLIGSAREGRIRVLEYKEVTPSPHVAKTLQLEMADRVFQLGVIFCIPKGPSRYSLFYFPPDLGKMIVRNELKETTEIIWFVEEKTHTRIHHAHQSVDVKLADKRISNYLSIKQNTPIFVMERQYIARDGSPIFMSLSYCRPDLYKFRIELTRT